jgi:hypothetical protein
MVSAHIDLGRIASTISLLDECRRAKQASRSPFRRVSQRTGSVYGVFTALPSQLTVLAANGSTVYTENLQGKAAEAAQFCEGYAEP